MKKIGILGYGVVGKSVHQFLQTAEDDVQIAVWDKRQLDGAGFYSSQCLSMQDFIAEQDEIIVSPGFDLSLIPLNSKNVLCELDLFAHVFHKKTIAITGSLGKTTVTKLLALLLNQIQCNDGQFLKAAEGGNVGTAMLDLVPQQAMLDCAVLELSSFQLERNKTYAPDIGLLLNIFPNHLDRHKNMETYLDAKWQLFVHQRDDQKTILPVSLLDQDLDILPRIKALRSQLWFTSVVPLDYNHLCMYLGRSVNLIELRGNQLWMTQVGCEPKLIGSFQLPDTTFIENWIMVLTALLIRGADMTEVMRVISASKCMLNYHHRVEFVGSCHDVDFYNDSKSTAVEATWAATQKLLAKERPVIVILGGLSKGVDRSGLQSQLKQAPGVKKVYCYGPECAPFTTAACFTTLENIIDDICAIMTPGDQVLFSPAGASFDLYENYAHRGEVFKELVKARMKTIQ